MARKWINSQDVDVDDQGRLATDDSQSRAVLTAILSALGSGFVPMSNPESSGTAPIATTSADPVTLLEADANHAQHFVRVRNEGSVAGFYSLDGGTTWHRIGPNEAIEATVISATRAAIQAKRDGATNMTGLYADRW